MRNWQLKSKMNLTWITRTWTNFINQITSTKCSARNEFNERRIWLNASQFIHNVDICPLWSIRWNCIEFSFSPSWNLKCFNVLILVWFNFHLISSHSCRSNQNKMMKMSTDKSAWRTSWTLKFSPKLRRRCRHHNDCLDSSTRDESSTVTLQKRQSSARHQTIQCCICRWRKTRLRLSWLLGRFCTGYSERRWQWFLC